MFDDNDSGVAIALGVVGIVVAAIIFGVVMLGSNNGGSASLVGAPVASSSAASGASVQAYALGTLGFASANGKITLSGFAPDERRKARLGDQAALVFGAENVTNNIAVDVNIASRKWAGRSLDLMTKLKGLGDFNLGLDGATDTINFKGAAVDDAGKAGLAAWLGSFFKTGSKVNADIALNPALSKLAAMNPASLFNITVEFASGSAEIPESAKLRLNLVADIIKEDGRKVIVAGHTDNEGDAAANKVLSLKRAQSVIAFLGANGVADGAALAVGLGAEQPIADNSNPVGRAANRRIEFLNQ